MKYRTKALMRGTTDEWELPAGTENTGRTDQDGETLWVEFPLAGVGGGVWFPLEQIDHETGIFENLEVHDG